MSNAPLGLAVVCRKVQNSIIQVLLHKTGNSPYNQRSWAFPGGLMNQPNDNRDNWYGGVTRELEHICRKEGGGQMPPVTPIANTMESASTGKNYVYYVVAIPAGNENWPHVQNSNEFLSVGGIQCPTKQGFVWVDWNAMLNEAASFKQTRNQSSNIHKNVLQWFASNGERILLQLGGSRNTQPSMGGGGGGRDGMEADRNTICKFIQSGQPCKFGDRCKFSHNVAGNAPGAFGGGGAMPFGATTGSSVFPGSPGGLPAAAVSTALPGSGTPVDPNTPQLKQLAEMFVSHYLQMLQNPASDFSGTYAPTGILTFESESVIGNQQINAKLKQIQMQGVKALKLWNASWQQISGTNTVMISIAGMLVIEGRPEMPSVQVFHLIQNGASWLVSNHMFYLMKAPGA